MKAMRSLTFNLAYLVLFSAIALGQSQETPMITSQQPDSAPPGNPCELKPQGLNLLTEPLMTSAQLFGSISNVPQQRRTPTLKRRTRSTDQPDANSTPSPTPPTTFVSVFVLPNLGPVGEAYTPSELGGLVKVSESLIKDYFFPSLYFDISSSPLLIPVLGDDVEAVEYEKTIKKVRNTDRDMKWMDVTLELFPWCADKKDKK